MFVLQRGGRGIVTFQLLSAEGREKYCYVSTSLRTFCQLEKSDVLQILLSDPIDGVINGHVGARLASDARTRFVPARQSARRGTFLGAVFSE